MSSSSNGTSSSTVGAVGTSSSINGQKMDAGEHAENKAQLAKSQLSAMSTSSGNNCEGCGVLCNDVNGTPKGRLCNSCFQHWRYIQRTTRIESSYLMRTLRLFFFLGLFGCVCVGWQANWESATHQRPPVYGQTVAERKWRRGK